MEPPANATGSQVAVGRTRNRKSTGSAKAEQAEAEQSARVRWLVAAAVGILTVSAFLPSVQGEFVTWDDNRNFLENPHYRGLGWPQLRWMWSTTLLGHYIPLTWMSLGLDYALWGMNPVGYHAGNLILHAANAMLLFRLALTLFRLSFPGVSDRRAFIAPAAIAALFFAIHPLRVESVAWITERRDMLSLLFLLLSIHAYLRSVTARDRNAYWTSVGLFICALLSKGVAVTLPAVLVCLNIFPLRRLHSVRWPELRILLVDIAPFAVLSAGFAMLSIIVLHPPEQLDVAGKVAVSLFSLAWYLWKTIWPSDLAPLYEMPQALDPWEPRFIAAYVAVAALAIGIWSVRTKRGALAAIAAFLCIIFPLLGVVQNGPQLVADRYTYHAAPALGLLLAGALYGWRQRTAGMAAAVAFIAVMFPLTWRQATIWRTSESLWSRVLQVDSTSSIGHIAMGGVLFHNGQVQRAVSHYERGLRYDPDYAEGYNNLGVALSQLGRFSEAASSYERAIALKPRYADAMTNLGIVLARQGRLDDAILRYREALDADSLFANAHTNWGNALVRQAKYSEAIEHYAIAIRMHPEDAAAELNWGVALAQSGDIAAAVPHFERAVALQPDSPDARAYLARAVQVRGGTRAP